MKVREYDISDYKNWKRLRLELWPDTDESEHEEEMKIISSGGKFGFELDWSIFVVEDNNELLGFIESSLREKVNGYNSTPVGYIEGWYVDNNYRKKGIGKLLTSKAEKWAKSKGCYFMASDVEFHNKISLEAHQRLGYKVIDKDDTVYILIKDI